MSTAVEPIKDIFAWKREMAGVSEAKEISLERQGDEEAIYCKVGTEDYLGREKKEENETPREVRLDFMSSLSLVLRQGSRII